MENAKVLILEDSKERQEQFKKNFKDADITIVEHKAEAVAALLSQKWDYMFLDHDLGGKAYVNVEEEDSGSGVARWLKDHPQSMPSHIFVHSVNEAGAKNIISLIGGKHVPFVWTKEISFKE